MRWDEFIFCEVFLTGWGPLGTVDTFLLSVDRDYQYDSSVTFGEHREMWRGSFF